MVREAYTGAGPSASTCHANEEVVGRLPRLSTYRHSGTHSRAELDAVVLTKQDVSVAAHFLGDANAACLAGSGHIRMSEEADDGVRGWLAAR